MISSHLRGDRDGDRDREAERDLDRDFDRDLDRERLRREEIPPSIFTLIVEVSP